MARQGGGLSLANSTAQFQGLLDLLTNVTGLDAT